VEIIAESKYRLVIRGTGRCGCRVWCSPRALIPDPAADRALEQVVNVAELPGIVVASYAMPDVHWGYGFPNWRGRRDRHRPRRRDLAGRVGFDIACGVRLLAAELTRDELLPVRDRVMDRLADVIPCGAGRGGLWHLRGRAELEKLLADGVGYAVACGHGGQRDLDRCEDRGVVEDADLAQVSSRALDRGLHQVGSLRSENHFLERLGRCPPGMPTWPRTCAKPASQSSSPARWGPRPMSWPGSPEAGHSPQPATARAG